MHKPKLPGIPEIEKFKGHSFHTTRWDYSYTGGGPSAPMDKLRDKRVGIVGTGATAVQAVPKLAEASKHLFVFQRTPSGVAARNNKPTSAEWTKSLKPGWQEARMDNFASIMVGEAWDEDLVQDGWTEIFGRNKGTALSTQDQQLYDFMLMDQIRARVDAIISDKATAEALKPWYNRLCKRPCFHDEYLQAFSRSNVTLVDTAGKGIDRMTEDGPIVNGKQYPLDVLIYASGFEMGTSYNKRLGFEIYGREGRSLTDAWADGPRTLHGAMTNGFPNLIMLGTTQGGYTVNF
jgi:cation diffusion facilitator CzcD-associated flavoprotein CzcO